MRFKKVVAFFLLVVAVLICSPAEAQKKTVPDIFTDRDDVKAAMRNAWEATAHGTRKTEAGFFVVPSPTGYKIVPHGFTNETDAISTEVPDLASAEFHVHPENSIPQPSANDKKIAEQNRLDIYTISSKGVFEYSHLTRKVAFLGDIEDVI